MRLYDAKRNENEDLLASPGESESPEDERLGRFDGQHGLRLNRLYCLPMEIQDLDGLGALSSVFDALRQLQLRAPQAV